MPKFHAVKPHPAFETKTICPGQRSTSATYTKESPHYPPAYVENLAPLHVTVDSPPDVVGWTAVAAVGMVGSMLVALFNPTWLLDSKGFGLGALVASPREAIYLRRVLLIATILSSHGLGCAYGAHLRGLFFGTCEMEMVLSKEGEWRSHRAHQQILIEAFRPGFFTRLFLIFLQGFSLFMSFASYIIYPPMILAVDRHMNALATRVHSDALSVMEKDKEAIWQMKDMTAPLAARLFWSLPTGALLRDVVYCMRGDDTWHANFNGVCCDEGYQSPGKKVEHYIDTGVKVQ